MYFCLPLRNPAKRDEGGPFRFDFFVVVFHIAVIPHSMRNLLIWIPAFARLAEAIGEAQAGMTKNNKYHFYSTLNLPFFQL